MCQVTNKIKFCTCEKPSDSTNSYWIFHRFNPGGDGVFGSAKIQQFVDRETEVINKETLEKRINEPNAFDTDLKPQTGDKLRIVLPCDHGFNGLMIYDFLHEDGEWKASYRDPFLNNLHVETKGEIKPIEEPLSLASKRKEVASKLTKLIVFQKLRKFQLSKQNDTKPTEKDPDTPYTAL